MRVTCEITVVWAEKQKRHERGGVCEVSSGSADEETLAVRFVSDFGAWIYFSSNWIIVAWALGSARLLQICWCYTLTITFTSMLFYKSMHILYNWLSKQIHIQINYYFALIFLFQQLPSLSLMQKKKLVLDTT